MATPITISPKDHECELHKFHIPAPLILHGHHIIPKYMQAEFDLDLGADQKLLVVCPTGHYNIHNLIERILKGERPRGRRGKTFQYAQDAAVWYREHKK